MDYGKFKYEASKRANRDKKKQHRILVKEVKFRVKIDEHDFMFKIGNAKKFLESQNRVKFTVNFRGREISHPELGRELLDRAAEEIADIGTIESPARQEGFSMTMYVIPRKDKPAPPKRSSPEAAVPKPKAVPKPETTPEPEAASGPEATPEPESAPELEAAPTPEEEK
jgi:translation initiation factor IF-3